MNLSLDDKIKILQLFKLISINYELIFITNILKKIVHCFLDDPINVFKEIFTIL